MKQPTVKILKALANPTRLGLVRQLAACPEGKSCDDLSAKFYLSQPTMSHHFIKLVEAEVVVEGKAGTQKSYVLNRQLLKKHGISVNKL